jgi:hypothetical protein
LLLLGVAASAAYFQGVSASAQDGRGDPYEPRGMRLGGFKLFPKLTVEETSNDNIFAQETGTSSDYITKVSPSLSLKSDFNNHALNFSASSDIVRYKDSDPEDYDDFTVKADGRIDILRKTKIDLAAEYQLRHEDRGSDDDAAGIEPTKYTTTEATIGFEHKPGRIALGLGVGTKRWDYDDVAKSGGTVVNNDDRDGPWPAPLNRIQMFS